MEGVEEAVVWKMSEMGDLVAVDDNSCAGNRNTRLLILASPPLSPNPSPPDLDVQ